MQAVFIFWNIVVFVPCVRGVRKTLVPRAVRIRAEVSVGTKYNTYTWCLVLLLYSDEFIQGQTSEGLMRPCFFLLLCWAAPSEGHVDVFDQFWMYNQLEMLVDQETQGTRLGLNKWLVELADILVQNAPQPTAVISCFCLPACTCRINACTFSREHRLDEYIDYSIPTK